jgi:hypothetical protein
MSLIQVKELKHKKLSECLDSAIGKYKQLRHDASDFRNGRCAAGAILSEMGWDGKSWATVMVDRFPVLGEVIMKNDHLGQSFEQIRDWLIKQGE